MSDMKGTINLFLNENDYNILKDVAFKMIK